MSSLRALFLNENIGGHATVHLNLERAFGRRQDISATFINVPPRGLGRKLLGHSVPGLRRLDLDFQALRAQLAAAAVARRLLAAGVSGGHDALHVYTQNAGLLSVAIMRAQPTVVSTDSTSSLNAYRLPYRPAGRSTPQTVRISQVFERRPLRAATVVVANTKWVARAISATGVPDERVRVIPFGIELPAWPSPRSDRPRAQITFIGFTLERKGGRLLIELHQRFLRDHCDLLLVTTDHVERLPGVNVRSDVRPGDGKLESILGTTTVMVFPSPIDQAPNVVLEAMAYGVPVIALRTGGVPEMVEHGVTGLLVDVGDEAGLVKAIRSLVNDRERAAAMGRAARAAACERYDIDVTAARLVDVLNEARELHGRCGPID